MWLPNIAETLCDSHTHTGLHWKSSPRKWIAWRTAAAFQSFNNLSAVNRQESLLFLY